MKSSIFISLFFFFFHFNSKNGCSQSVDTMSMEEGVKLYQKALAEADTLAMDAALLHASQARHIFEQHQYWEYVLDIIGFEARLHSQLLEVEKAKRLLEQYKSIALAHPKEGYAWEITYYFLFGTLMETEMKYKNAKDYFYKSIDFAINLESDKLTNSAGMSEELFLQQVEDYKNMMIAASYNMLGFAHRFLGDYEKSLNAYFLSLDHYKRCPDNVGGNNLGPLISEVYGNIASDYILKTEHQTAEEYFGLSLKALDNHNMPIRKASILFTYAVLYFYQEDFENCAKILDDLIPLFESGELQKIKSRTGYGELESYASVLALKALIEAKQGKTEKSKKDLEKAYELMQGNIDRNNLSAEVFLRMSLTQKELGKTEQAFKFLQKSLSMLNENIDLNDPSTNPDPETCMSIPLSIKIVCEKALLFNETGDIENAFSTADKAIILLEEYRGSIANSGTDGLSIETSLLDLENLSSNIFEIKINAAFLLWERTRKESYKEEIFKASEKSKTFALRNAIDRVRKFAGMPEEVLNIKDSLMNEIVFAEKKLRALTAKYSSGNKMEEDNKEQQATFEVGRSELGKKRKDYNAFISSLRDDPKYARYFSFQLDNDIPGLSDIKSILLKDGATAIVEFAESETRLQTVLLSPQGINVFSVEKPKDWNELISRHNKHRNNLNLIALKKVASGFVQSGNRLYKLLLEKPLSALDQKIDRLIFVPHGNSHLIDFELLSTSNTIPAFEEVEGLDYALMDCSKTDFLMKKYAISYAPSITILMNELKHQPQRPADRDYGLISFAPSYDKRNQMIEMMNDGVVWKNLPDEISTVHADIFMNQPNLAIKGAEATEEKFMEVMQKHSSAITHVSAHGVLNNELPLFSRLIFEMGEYPNGDIEIAELYNLRMKTDLTVLSACDSGIGEFAKPGEGRMTLARGVAYAGCPSIVMSLWELEVEPNKKMVHLFYKNLSENSPIDQALRKAKLEYIKKVSEELRDDVPRQAEEIEKLFKALHPNYWGGLVPYGRMDALNLVP